MKTTIAAALFVAVFASSQPALAQVAAFQPWPARPISSPPLWQHHASTFEEGALRGWADIGRAIGELNYNTSLAMINRQEAIRRGLQNRKQFVQTYFDVKQINHQARYGDAQLNRPSQADLIRRNQQRMPDRLANHEYHRTLGKLNWPHVLRDELFAAERAAVDQAMAERTIDNSGVGSENYLAIEAAAAQMETKLKGQIDQLTTAESIAARRFLASLRYESRLPLGMDIGELAIR